MKHEVVSIKADATLIDAAQLLARKKVGTLPVVDKKGELIGLTNISKVVRIFLPDFINVIEDVDFVHDFGAIDLPSPIDIKKAGTIKIKEMMDAPVSVEEDASLMRALSIMVTHDLLDLPVVRAGKLVGIASRVDIGRAFLLSGLGERSSPKKKSSR